MKAKDLTGLRFGHLVVVGEAPVYVSPKGYRKRMWHCICDCGNACVIMGSHLISGHTKSCSCRQTSKLVPKKVRDLSGMRFGMLTVVKRMPNRQIGKNSRVNWQCICDCGKITNVLGLLLTNGRVKSCGCTQMSHSERIMHDYLQDIGVKYVSEYVGPYLLGVNDGVLKFDFAIFGENNNLICLIELDGLQHKEPVAYFGGDLKYNTTKANDRIKNKWCHDNGIPLIRIDVSSFTLDEDFFS